MSKYEYRKQVSDYIPVSSRISLSENPLNALMVIFFYNLRMHVGTIFPDTKISIEFDISNIKFYKKTPKKSRQGFDSEGSES